MLDPKLAGRADGFGKGHQGHAKGTGQQGDEVSQADIRQPGSGQAGGNVAHNVNVARIQVKNGNDDDAVNNIDLAIIQSQWPDTGCGTCGGADLTGEGDVTIADLLIMANSWTADFSLKGVIVSQLVMSQEGRKANFEQG